MVAKLYDDEIMKAVEEEIILPVKKGKILNELRGVG